MNYVYNMNNIKKQLKSYNYTQNFIIQQILEQIKEIDKNNEIIIEEDWIDYQFVYNIKYSDKLNNNNTNDNNKI